MRSTQPVATHPVLNMPIEMGESMSKSVVIIKVLAEGGSIKLYGLKTKNGWQYSRDVMDQTPEMIDEKAIQHRSPIVKTWPEALALVNRYPWHRLSPDEVRPGFGVVVFKAVTEKLQEEGRADPKHLAEWAQVCGTLAS